MRINFIPYRVVRSPHDVSCGWVRPSSLQRELAALVKADILCHRCDGTRVYVQANPHGPLVLELQGLLIKTVGK